LKISLRFGEHVASVFRVEEQSQARNQRDSRWLDLFFDLEDGYDVFLRNVG
jgi:hypothetical protein